MRARRRSNINRSKQSKQSYSRGQERNAVIMFVDVIGCSEISNHKEIKEYNDFIDHFQKHFDRICKMYQKKFYSNNKKGFDYEHRGDEGCLKIYASKKSDNDQLARDIDIAVSIAFDLKIGWLLTDENQNRIEQRLLPIELAVGIHFGKVYVKNNNAEGYAINLAKRIESSSRDGKFTHILLSESAHGQLNYLKYERTYKFDQPSIKKTKGISNTIKAFEIKHHYLATDWEDTFFFRNPEETTLFPKNTLNKICKVLKNAYEINPTNLWIAEEYINSMILHVGIKLRDARQEDNRAARRKAYAPVLEVARRIANSDLRDATLLSIWGQILGYREEFKLEEEKYNEAIELNKADGDFYWYRGLCLSYQLDEVFQKSNLEKKEFFNLKENQDKVKRILKEYEKAMELKSVIHDIEYDYAAEYSWWGEVKKSYRNKAVRIAKRLLKEDPEIKHNIQEEEYFQPILGDLNLK